jgi:hypothetical protein
MTTKNGNDTKRETKAGMMAEHETNEQDRDDQKTAGADSENKPKISKDEAEKHDRERPPH